MSNELIKFGLQEKDLVLVVSEKTLGSLTTNAKEIKAMVELALPNYDISNYSEDNIDLAKKDKAMLNAASKALNAKRLEFEKEFMKPFGEFKEVIGETVKLISECSKKIDTVVKQSEQVAKDNKRRLIAQYWDSLCFDLVPLSKIFNERWLNKTTKEKDIYAEIAATIASIKDDIVTIEAIGEETELLKSIYLDTLSLNSTIQYANRLKKNKEIAAREAEARESAKREVKVAPPTEPAVHITPAPPVKQVTYTPEPATQLLTRAFQVTASREQIIALADYMTANGIVFNKIEREEE